MHPLKPKQMELFFDLKVKVWVRKSKNKSGKKRFTKKKTYINRTERLAPRMFTMWRRTSNECWSIEQNGKICRLSTTFYTINTHILTKWIECVCSIYIYIYIQGLLSYIHFILVLKIFIHIIWCVARKNIQRIPYCSTSTNLWGQKERWVIFFCPPRNSTKFWFMVK